MGDFFFDYDNDGDLDLLVNNSGGLQGRDDPARNNTFFRNNGDGQFTELFDTGLESDTFYSYGSATADFNNDGYLDVAILNAYGHKSQLFQNSGGTNNWIKIGLEGTVSNREDWKCYRNLAFGNKVHQNDTLRDQLSITK